jgi:hypothetical protein
MTGCYFFGRNMQQTTKLILFIALLLAPSILAAQTTAITVFVPTTTGTTAVYVPTSTGTVTVYVSNVPETPAPPAPSVAGILAIDSSGRVIPVMAPGLTLSQNADGTATLVFPPPRMSINETPQFVSASPGADNSSTITTWQLQHTPTSLMCYRNGILQSPVNASGLLADYTIGSGGMLTSPSWSLGDSIMCFYTY